VGQVFIVNGSTNLRRFCQPRVNLGRGSGSGLRGGPELIELPTKVLPVRQIQVHRHGEACAVRWLQQVNHLVDEDVFETLGRRLRVATRHLFARACNALCG
jgi:hypothetical protein